jgi:hypothetical protein
VVFLPLATITTAPDLTSYARLRRSSEPPSAAFYSNGKMRRQSFSMLTTVQPFALALVECLVELPDGRGAIIGKFSNCVVVVDE